MRDRFIPDTRIHCCVFFINPSGHTLKPVSSSSHPLYICMLAILMFQHSCLQIDVVVLRKLAEVVNVVPIIAKSDSLTLEERALFKQRVSIVARTEPLCNCCHTKKF